MLILMTTSNTHSRPVNTITTKNKQTMRTGGARRAHLGRRASQPHTQSMYSETCIYIYIYTYIHYLIHTVKYVLINIYSARTANINEHTVHDWIRPISLLTLSLLTLLDSNFPGNSLWTWEFHPLKLRLCSSRTPLNSTMLVGRLGVHEAFVRPWEEYIRRSRVPTLRVFFIPLALPGAPYPEARRALLLVLFVLVCVLL